MGKFRKKTEAFEAVQLDLTDREATRKLLESMGATPGTFDMPLVANKACWWRQSTTGEFSLIIHTGSGEDEAKHGDWIIKDRSGGFYIECDELFQNNYEAA